MRYGLRHALPVGTVVAIVWFVVRLSGDAWLEGAVVGASVVLAILAVGYGAE